MLVKSPLSVLKPECKFPSEVKGITSTVAVSSTGGSGGTRRNPIMSELNRREQTRQSHFVKDSHLINRETLMVLRSPLAMGVTLIMEMKRCVSLISEARQKDRAHHQGLN